MNKYKVLIGKRYQMLSVTETNNSIPEGKDIYYDMGKDMRIPDFVLVRADNIEEARRIGQRFIERWKQEHETSG